MSEAAVAYISVVPSAAGFGNKLASQIDGQSVGSTVGDSVGAGFLGKVGSIAGGAAKILGGAIGGGAAAIGGISLGKGLSRALDIQDAQKKLLGLGHSANDVTKIMGSALAAVKGTAFGLGDAATVAASAVAAGIKPGTQLTKYLKLTADSATIAGTSLGDMGQILNSVNANGTVYTGTLNQLSDRGIPVFQYLAEQYGVTQEALSKMVSKGQVDAATLDKVLQQHLSGSALKSGETARGAFDNVGAAFGRLGVAFGAGTAVDKAPALFTAISSGVDRASAAFAPLATILNTALAAGFDKVTAYINGINFDVVAQKVTGVVTKIETAFKAGGIQGVINSVFSGIKIPELKFNSQGISTTFGALTSIATQAGPALQGIAASFGSLSAALGGVFAAGLRVATPLLNVLAGVLGYVADHMDTVISVLPLIVAAFIAWRGATTTVLAANRLLTAAQLAALPVTTANTALRLAAARAELQVAVATGASSTSIVANAAATASQAVSTVAARVAMIAGAAATGVATAAQWLFNAALSANPIGIVVVAIAALVAGLIFFFTQTQLGRAIFANVVAFIQSAIAATAAVIRTVLSAVGQYFTAEFTAIGTVVRVVFAAIGAYVSAGINIVKTVISTGLALVKAIFTGNWGAIPGIVSGAVGRIGGIVSGLIGTVAGLLGTLGSRALSAVGRFGSLLVSSGRALIQGFINGITGMIGAVGKAVGGVMNYVASFFPHSPAERGPFSGSGWRQVGKSGAALADQFSSGFNSNLAIAPISAGNVNIGRTALPAQVRASSTQAGQVNVLVNNKTGVNLADLIDIRIAKNSAEEEQAWRLGYQPLVFG